MKEETIVNKVTASGIQSLDLMAYSPTVEFVHFDIAPYLYMGLIVKEKEFRKALETIDWASYENKAVSIGCAVEAILPQWVFMDIASKLYPYAFAVIEGTSDLHKEQLWAEKLMQQDFGIFTGQKVTLIANPDIPVALYVLATNLLTGSVASLMYGEPGLPKVIYKKAK